jgi:hypothetical protein
MYKGDSTMKRPILFVSCILVMCAVSLASPTKNSTADSAKILSQITNLSWDRKTPLQTEGEPFFINKPNLSLSVADTHDRNVNTPENAYSIPAPSLLILTGIGIASIGCLHRKKRL